MTTRSSIIRILAAGLALALVLPATAQDVQYVPGTSVLVAPPAGFVLTTRYPGFFNAETGASILVTELPAAEVAPLQTAFSDVDAANLMLGAQGIAITERIEVDSVRGPIPVLHGGRPSPGGGISIDAWYALAIGEGGVILTINSPGVTPVDEATVRAIVASLVPNAEPTVEQRVAALPYGFTLPDGFTVQAVAGFEAVIGQSGAPDTGSPLIAITYASLAAPLMGTPDLVAESALSRGGYADVVVTSSETVPFAGADGLLAQGTATIDGTPVAFAQWSRFESEFFIQVLLAAAPETIETAIEPATAIAQSLSLE